MSKKILLIFGSPVNFHAKERIENYISYIELDKSDNQYFLFSPIKSSTMKNYISGIKKEIEIIDGRSYMSAPTWTESMNVLKETYEKFKFDKVVIIFCQLLAQYFMGHEKGIWSDWMLINNLPKNDKTGMNFEQRRRSLKRLGLNMYFQYHHGCEMNHFIVDPLETNYDELNNYFNKKEISFKFKNQAYYYNQSDRLHSNYFPFIEWGYMYRQPVDVNLEEKQYDFSFGMTAIVLEKPYRFNIIDKLKEIIPNFDSLNLSHNYFFKDKRNKDDESYQSCESYMNYILKSKWTLIIPSYDEDEFTSSRWIESIHRGCIPFIYKDTKWMEYMKHHDDWKRIIEKWGLVVDLFEIPNKIKELEPSRLEIISEIRGIDYQKMQSEDWYLKYAKLEKDNLF